MARLANNEVDAGVDGHTSDTIPEYTRSCGHVDSAILVVREVDASDPAGTPSSA